MKILILGSEGFIGKHLITYFIQAGQIVYGCDLFESPSQKYRYTKVSRLSPELSELLTSAAFDVCINVAGSGNVPFSMEHPFIDFESNSLDVIRILDGIRLHQPQCRYIQLSSAAVYGNPVDLPVKETTALSPLSPYGWHKLIAENLCKEYKIVYGVSSVIVRPFSVYGEGLKKQLFWDLYQKYKNSKKNETISLLGSGNETRDYIYIEDLVKAISIIIQRARFESEVYNIASGIETSIAEAASCLIKYVDPQAKLSFSNEIRKGDPINWKADITALQNLGFTPSVDLNTGLYNLSKWLKNQN